MSNCRTPKGRFTSCAPAGRRAASYSWIITQDKIFDPRYDKSSDVGLMGPRKPHLTAAQIKKHPDREAFAMYDDDGNLYYRGFLVGGDGFEPLEDYGMPNAGATEIRYKSPKTGRWESL